MANYKKQHYVPRFYLRNFCNKGRMDIDLYNFNASKCIRNIPVADQAYEAYFYGDDLVWEKRLGEIESRASILISHIIDSRSLDSINSDGFFHLLVYTLSQCNRTREVANEMENTMNDVFKLVGKYDDAVKHLVDTHSVKLQGASLNHLAMIPYAADMCRDLGVKLVLSEGQMPFITSDNPVILINPFDVMNKRPPGLGFGCRGIVIFLPLSPDLGLIFYDSKIYKLGSKKSDNVVVAVQDVKGMNVLQTLNATKCIFFNESFDDHSIIDIIAKRVGGYIKSKSGVAAYTDSVITMSEGEKYILLSSPGVSFNWVPLFCHLTKFGKKYKYSDYLVQLRNEMWRGPNQRVTVARAQALFPDLFGKHGWR